MKLNKYELSRNIPADIKRKIRQRCGFGCINCGCAIYQYEHVDPVFAEAREHDPNCIVLLCGGCHDRVTRGFLSKETIKSKSSNPKCFEDGFSFGPFDLGNVEPQITLGTMKSVGVKTLIRIYGDDVLSICPPEESGQPFLISANIKDREGNEILRIENNEWLTTVENWDVEVVGTNIKIRRNLGDILLSLRSEPPNNLIFEKLEMFHRGVKIFAEENKNIEIVTLTGQHLQSSGVELYRSLIGIDIDKKGMSIGVGGGSMRVESMRIGSSPRPESRINYIYLPQKLPFMLKPLIAAIYRIIYAST